MKLASFILLTGDCRYVSRDQRALSFFLPSLSNICDTHVAPCILYLVVLLFSASVFTPPPLPPPPPSVFLSGFFTPNLVCLSLSLCRLCYRFTLPGIQLSPAIIFHRKRTMCSCICSCIQFKMFTAALFAVSSGLSVGLFLL